MKILLISTVYPPDIGGPSLQCRQIAGGFIASGHQVKILVPRDRGVTDPDPFVDELRLPAGNGISRLLRQWELLVGLWRVIRSFQPDIVHVQVFGGPTCILTGLLCRLLKIPSLVKLTGESSIERAGERPGTSDKARAERWKRPAQPAFVDWITARMFCKVWATSPVYEGILLSEFGLAPKTVVMIPNFVDLAAFYKIQRSSPGNRELRLLTVCRLRTWKGLETGIDAVKLLVDSEISWQIVGDGSEEYQRDLEQRVSAAKLDKKILFVGGSNPDEVSKHYEAADIFLLLSNYEPFGIVLIEAMAAGLPVIATRTGGIPFVLGGAEAELVPAGDGTAAAAAIARTAGRLRQDPKIGEKNRRIAERFDLGHGLEKLIATYQVMSIPKTPESRGVRDVRS